MSANETMKLKPFNLEAALKGEKVVTRDGREVTDIREFPTATEGYRVAAVLNGDIETFTESGKYDNFGQTSADLFMAPKERVVWANIYKNGVWIEHKTEEDADNRQDLTDTRLGGRAYPITVEED
jgi:hypothetical protein